MAERAIIVNKVKDLFRKGETVFREGEEGNEMYIIQTGKVEVLKNTGDEEVILATHEPKAFFGEMALFGEPKRSATIRAVEDTQMICITKRMLESQFERVPEWFVTILKTLVERLRSTNKAVKSRFRISFEFSILKMIYLTMKKYGENTENGLSVALDKSKTCITNVLGISDVEFMERLKNLAFVGFLKYSDSKNQIVIQDSAKVLAFLTFLRTKSLQVEDELDETRIDQTMKDYFEKIYKLLFRRKL